MPASTKKKIRVLSNKLRISQWYKNLLIFIGLIFEKKFIDLQYDLVVFLGFMALCLISSSNYVINDYVDRKNDELNQIKKFHSNDNKTIQTTLIYFLILFGSSLTISIIISLEFFLFIILIAMLGQVYNLFAKKVFILDIIILALIYILRTYSGYYLISVSPSNLIIIPVIVLALYLIFIKKRSIILILNKENAIEFRSSYKYYTGHRIETALKIIFISLIFVYFAYILLNEKFNIIVLISTYPFVIYILYEIFKLTKIFPEMGIFLWKIIKIKKILIASACIICLYMFAIFSYVA
mgnify:CR=1 FL=1